MDWASWEPRYRAILRDFGFSERADQEAAKTLDRLLAGASVATEGALRTILEDRHVVVAGPALSGPLPSAEVLIASDSALEAVQAQGRHPEILVTDLDGAPEEQVKANACCTLAVIHAHGDNLPALHRWVPRFQGRVVGTCQCEPVGSLHNFGGFTDGDRACHLAAHFGARSIRLAGFDFQSPVAKEGKDGETKRRKLAWAQRLLEELGVPLDPLEPGEAPPG